MAVGHLLHPPHGRALAALGDGEVRQVVVEPRVSTLSREPCERAGAMSGGRFPAGHEPDVPRGRGES